MDSHRGAFRRNTPLPNIITVDVVFVLSGKQIIHANRENKSSRISSSAVCLAYNVEVDFVASLKTVMALMMFVGEVIVAVVLKIVEIVELGRTTEGRVTVRLTHPGNGTNT